MHGDQGAGKVHVKRPSVCQPQTKVAKSAMSLSAVAAPHTSLHHHATPGYSEHISRRLYSDET
jgi:hypothetical protein